MIGINSVTIIGNIGTISEIRTTSNGAKFVNISVATTETFHSLNSENKSDTQWHNVIIWNNMTELHKILHKGDLLYVEGRINYRKKPNQIFTEIVAKNIRVLTKKSYNSDSQKSIDALREVEFDDDTFENNYDGGNDFEYKRTFPNE
jgi:single-strand DNA-binding protein